MKTAGYKLCRAIACSLLLLLIAGARAEGDEWLDRKVRLGQSKGTRYQMLRDLSVQTGYLFVYDSRTLENDTVVKVRKGTYALRDAIRAVAGNPDLQISRIGSVHILLSLPGKKTTRQPVPAVESGEKYFTVSGTVSDQYSKEPVTSASVSISGLYIGTVTNQDGRFRLTLPDSLKTSVIKISHVGYESLEFEAGTMAGMHSGFLLEPQIVSLQEVVVRAVNPTRLLQDMVERIGRNYSAVPVYLTSFYREGVEHKKRNIDLTEGVLKIYKTGYGPFSAPDQVKLVKMRRIIDKQERDTLAAKVKSGIYSVLMLDVMKHLPDFLSFDLPYQPFTYAHTDISVIDGRLVHVISFEQRPNVKDPLFRGELFVDADNYALAEARFEIHPAHVQKATNLFVQKKSRFLNLTLRSAKYAVSYKPSEDSIYYINRVRGDLEFRVRRKKEWFSSPLKIWFELVNCRTETEHVRPFSRSGRLSPHTVFSETKHPYDAGFWEHFNVIVPEEELRELILDNLTEIAEIPEEGE